LLPLVPAQGVRAGQVTFSCESTPELAGLAADFVRGRSSLGRFLDHAPAHRFGSVKTGASLRGWRA
jgi:hypothetical protein